MTGLLRDARAVYQKEGPAVLFLKGLRTAVEPVLGSEQARLLQFGIARRFANRELNPSKLQLPEKRIDIESEHEQIFFGFYDHTPFCHENRRVLFCKTDTPVGPVSPDDVLDLCYYDLETEGVKSFAKTRTWNWQQGCRLHWHPVEKDTVIFNTIVNGEYGSVCKNIRTGEILREYCAPIYDTDPNGEYALSLNFSRLERLHYDYGYVNIPDETSDDPAPSDDGIFRFDLETGEKDLLVSYRELAESVGIPNGVHNYCMNLMINPTGEWVSVLHRYRYGGDRITQLFAISSDDGDLTLLQGEGEASHPFWRSDTELLSTVNFWNSKRRTDFILYDVESGARSELDHSDLNVDSHPNVSPTNSSVFVGDTYPDYSGERHLYLFNAESGVYQQIGKVYGPVYNGTKRDLHPRWDRAGNYICVDVPKSENSQSISIIEISS